MSTNKSLHHVLCTVHRRKPQDSAVNAEMLILAEQAGLVIDKRTINEKEQTYSLTLSPVNISGWVDFAFFQIHTNLTETVFFQSVI
jgi:hypothetical protein